MITKEGIETLMCFAPSCSMASPVAHVAMALEKGKKIEQFRAIHSIGKLLKLAENKGRDIDGRMVVEYFCSQKHFEDIEKSGTSVAAEIPDEFVPLLHTALPLTDGDYQNDDTCLMLGGLVPINQPGKEGFWIAHLAAKFWVPYDEDLKQDILDDQACFEKLLEDAVKLGYFDYSTCPKLAAETHKAIRILQEKTA